MNPTSSPQTHGVAHLSRNVLCARYSQCLDVAIDKGWQGFTCSQCEAYETEPPGETKYWEDQAGRCRALLKQVFSHRPSQRKQRTSRPRRRPDFPMAERELLDLATDKSRWEGSDAGAIQLPEAFLAHLMLLVENRPHE